MSKKVFCLLLVVFTLFLSCERNSVKKHLNEMYDSTVALDLGQMEKVASDTTNVENTQYLMICYFDSTECQSCATGKLYTWNNFQNKYGSKSVNFVFIFHPVKNEYQGLRAYLESKKEKKNIYIDTLGIFEQRNPTIPQSAIYHTMLIDCKDNKIKLVGDPRRSKKMETLFKKVLEERLGKASPADSIADSLNAQLN